MRPSPSALGSTNRWRQLFMVVLARNELPLRGPAKSEFGFRRREFDGVNGGASSTTKEAPADLFGPYTTPHTTPRLSPESVRTRHAPKMPLLDFLNGIVGETS
jgi:hypothetical protein